MDLRKKELQKSKLSVIWKKNSVQQAMYLIIRDVVVFV